MVFTIKLQPHDDDENPLTSQHDVLELIYDQTHNLVRILFALGFEIKETYVGFARQHEAAAEVAFPIIFSIGKNEKGEVVYNLAEDELNQHNFVVDCLVANEGRVPEISRGRTTSFESDDWCYVTFVLGAPSKLPSDHELLSLSHHAEARFYGMVRMDRLEEYVIQRYEKGDYDTGYFICDEDDDEEYVKIYYASNPGNAGFRKMQDESYVQQIIIPRGASRPTLKSKKEVASKKSTTPRTKTPRNESKVQKKKTDSTANNSIGGVREKSGAFAYNPLKNR
jgi:hypothetical protein